MSVVGDCREGYGVVGGRVEGGLGGVVELGAEDGEGEVVEVVIEAFGGCPGEGEGVEVAAGGEGGGGGRAAGCDACCGLEMGWVLSGGVVD